MGKLVWSVRERMKNNIFIICGIKHIWYNIEKRHKLDGKLSNFELIEEEDSLYPGSTSVRNTYYGS